MAKSGLFAGEITQAAPANQAITSKQKGFQWMEHDVWSPISGAFSSGVGYAATTDGWYVANPEVTHPLLNGSYPEFTMSTVFKSGVDPASSVHYAPFGIGGATTMDMFGQSSLNKIGIVVRSQTAATFNLNIVGDTVTLDSAGDDTVGWSPFHWYCVTTSYSQPLNDIAISIVNMSLGLEIVRTPAVINNVNIEFHANQCGAGHVGSSMGYGCRFGTNPTTPSIPWVGSLANTFVHNQYTDLTITGNRRKFSGIDGVINIGDVGQNPFSEQPLIYLPRGIPNDQRGTAILGDYPDDFYLSDPIEIDTDLPPEAS